MLLSFERQVTRILEHNLLFTKSLSTKLLNSLVTFPKAFSWWRFDCTITGKRKRIAKNSLITQLLAFGLILESHWPYMNFIYQRTCFIVILQRFTIRLNNQCTKRNVLGPLKCFRPVRNLYQKLPYHSCIGKSSSKNQNAMNLNVISLTCTITLY